MICKVIEVFIPEQYKDNLLLDVMDRNLIGFKLDCEDIKEVIVESDEFNSKIMKDDLVFVLKQNISGKEFIDIEKYEGGYDE